MMELRRARDQAMADAASTEAKICEIKEERLRKESLTFEAVLRQIEQGNIVEARQNLVFHTHPSLSENKLAYIVNKLIEDFEEADEETAKNYLSFLAKLTLDLASFLPEWNLKDRDRHGEAALSDGSIELLVARCEETISSWCAKKNLERSLMRSWLDETVLRFKVEGVTGENEARVLAAELLGESILDYIENMRASFSKSNLRKICKVRRAGRTQTEIGNDHTTNLEYAMWLGASFVTTNPVLIVSAWQLNPEIWTPHVDRIIHNRFSLKKSDELTKVEDQQKIEEAVECICTDVTMEVVYENARLLRGVFLRTDGRKGLVCLQVNPLKHADSDAMIREALYIYGKLGERFGGIPNVVFKLPATRAGLKAARELTSRGIGVTITVSFGMFQSLPFADVINEGRAIVSYLVVMNGRLASPVMDDLREREREDIVEAGRWAGVAVAKRLHRKLYDPETGGGRGYDPNKIKMIIASLRDYEGSFPDITEVVGVSVITVFPNIRRAFDSEEKWIEAEAIERPIDGETLRNLLRSQLFKQAYFVQEDPAEMKPSMPFFLEDEAKVIEYAPVKNTLGQFCDFRIKLEELIRDRISNLLS